MLTDNDAMTFGTYKGKKLIEVPASYLLDLYERGQAPKMLRAYIKSNMLALKGEARRATSRSRLAQCRGRRR